ncbi:MAG: hypothetical protein KG075_12495 [Alphaproteobacteria bacterium]|nr:hypothetical protein [Alphaproteobacteria bacterium]
MGWKIDDRGRAALHEDSGALFTIRGGPGVGIPDDFELVPPSGHGPWPPAKVKKLKQEVLAALPAAREENHRRRELATLVQSRAGGSTSRAASLIAQGSGRSVTARTVQSWLIGPARPSSRSCPAWAVAALAQHAPQAPGTEYPWGRSQAQYVLDRIGVEEADARIADDRRLAAKWRALSAPAMAEAMIELEQRLNGYVQHHNRQLSTLRTALDRATSFEEFRQLVRDSWNDHDTADALVRETRRAIEERAEEFAHPEGLPEQTRQKTP